MRRKPIAALLITGLLLALGLLIFGFKVRSSNESLFGKPSASLSQFQKIRYSLMVYLNRLKLSQLTVIPASGTRFQILPGQSAGDVCGALNQAYPGLSAAACRAYMVYRSLDRDLEPGTYTINEGLQAYQLIERIADPANRNREFTLFPGMRLEEVSAAIDSLGLRMISSAPLLDRLQNPDEGSRLALRLQTGQSLEGYLFPNAYSFEPDITLDPLVFTLSMAARTWVEEQNWPSGLSPNGLSARQVLVMASIIQRETYHVAEMPAIAAVFYNRLQQGMPLQTDPTVQYALGYNHASASWWKPVLSLADLSVNSPYNTYQISGLPPGPIGAASMDAIQAVLHPAEHEYLFFRAKCDGSGFHDFSITYQEHLDKACP